MPKLLVIAVAVLAAISVAGFATAGEETFQVAMGIPVTWTFNATPATSAMTVAIVNNTGTGPTAKFEPATIEIPIDSTVIWTNLDNSAEDNQHTATSTGSSVIKSGVLNPGSSYAHTFDTAGEFKYHCEFHPDMEGTVIVTP